MGIQNKTAVIMGGAGAIGKAIAQRYAKEGAKIVIVDLNGEKAKAVAEEIKNQGGSASWICADVAEEPQVEKLTKEILEEYKGTKKYRKAGTAVLYCSDAVVSAILLLLQKDPGKKPDYDQVIDKIFERIWQKEIVSECDMTLHDWKRMQKIFKEEKLYYDFLR